MTAELRCAVSVVTDTAVAEVAGNYPRATAARLAALMERRDVPTRQGRLVLWHGDPGTGGTTAVRALSRAWAPWCDTHYVLDPEQLFSRPQYLLEVAGATSLADEDGQWRLADDAALPSRDGAYLCGPAGHPPRDPACASKRRG